MHYLLIANSPFTIVNFRKELIISLIDLGHKVSVAYPDSCNIISKEAEEEFLKKLSVSHYTIKLNRSGINPFNELSLIKSLFNVIQLAKPNVVINYTIKPSIFGSIVAKLSNRNIRVYSNMTGLGYVFTGNKLKHKLMAKIVSVLYKLAFKFNDKVFFQNIDDLNLFVEKSILSESKTVLINGSGVDTSYFSIKQEKTFEKLKFLFVGRLLEDKGIYEYLRAAEDLKKNYPDVEFHVAGAFDQHPTALTKTQLDKFLFKNIVKYHGNVKDIKSLYENVDVFVLPSYREGTPRSTLEAMSMSLPVITTNVPGCRETLIEGVNGFLVPHKDHIALAKAMERLILNRKLVRNFAVGSRQLAINKFDVHKVNHCIIQTVL